MPKPSASNCSLEQAKRRDTCMASQPPAKLGCGRLASKEENPPALTWDRAARAAMEITCAWVCARCPALAWYRGLVSWSVRSIEW